MCCWGIGSFGPRRANLSGLRRMIPFLLVGPVRHYLGENGSVITKEQLQGSPAIATPADRSNRLPSTTVTLSDAWSKPKRDRHDLKSLSHWERRV